MTRQAIGFFLTLTLILCMYPMQEFAHCSVPDAGIASAGSCTPMQLSMPSLPILSTHSYSIRNEEQQLFLAILPLIFFILVLRPLRRSGLKAFIRKRAAEIPRPWPQFIANPQLKSVRDF